jgi:hypothetical protein
MRPGVLKDRFRNPIPKPKRLTATEVEQEADRALLRTLAKETRQDAVRILCAMVSGISVVGADAMRNAAKSAWVAAAQLAALEAEVLKEKTKDGGSGEPKL